MGNSTVLIINAVTGFLDMPSCFERWPGGFPFYNSKCLEVDNLVKCRPGHDAFFSFRIIRLMQLLLKTDTTQALSTSEDVFPPIIDICTFEK